MMYQSEQEAAHSQEEHIAIVNAIQARDEPLALQLLDEHLCHVQAALIPETSSQTPPRTP
jgi:DNA-binding GntR family transcriptional regulator